MEIYPALRLRCLLIHILFFYVSITTGQLTLVWHEWMSDVPEIHSCDDLHVNMTMNMKRLILKFLIASIY